MADGSDRVEAASNIAEIAWCPEFSDGDADITLISSDKIGYKMYATELKRASTVFRNMLALPVVENENGQIHLDDSSAQLKPLLRLLTAREIPEDIDTMESILELADKYEMPGIVDIVHQLFELHGDIMITKHPLHTYVLACRFDLPDIKKKASTAALDVDIFDEGNLPLMKRLGLRDYHSLNDIRIIRRDLIHRRLRNILDSPSPSDSERWMTQCTVKSFNVTGSTWRGF